MISRLEFRLAFVAGGLVLAVGCGSASGPSVVRAPTVAPAPPAARVLPPHLDVTRILAFGDSLTEGAATPTDPPVEFVPVDPKTPGPAASYPFKLQALVRTRYAGQEIQIFNGGRGGETAVDARARFITLLDLLHPEVVILMDGVNDLNGGAAVAETAAKVRDLVVEAQMRGAVVFLSTLPRQRPGGRRASAVDQIVPFDRELAHIALQTGAKLVDIYPEISVTLVAPDGLHLIEAANQLLAEIYFDALRSAFETSSRRAADVSARRPDGLR